MLWHVLTQTSYTITPKPWFSSSDIQSIPLVLKHTHKVTAHRQSAPSKSLRSRLAELLLLCQPELIEPQAGLSSPAHIRTASARKAFIRWTDAIWVMDHQRFSCSCGFCLRDGTSPVIWGVKENKIYSPELLSNPLRTRSPTSRGSRASSTSL